MANLEIFFHKHKHLLGKFSITMMFLSNLDPLQLSTYERKRIYHRH